jgi:hypothetical protein
MDKSILFTKSFDLAVASAKLCTSQGELGRQALTIAWAEAIREIGANLFLSTEVSGSQQTFSIRLYTARKQCQRARFFTSLLRDAALFTEETAGIYEQELLEIVKMLQASLSTLREKRQTTVSIVNKKPQKKV